MYSKKEFVFPPLNGISEKSLSEHLLLYAGYVKNTNDILEAISQTTLDQNIRRELNRRLSFEFNGMRNHEYYFENLSEGKKEIDQNSKLFTQITHQWGSYDVWTASFIELAKTRGIGWAILYWDRENKNLIRTWVDEQHIGHLNSCTYILGIDMWEHAYVADYQPSGKATYIEHYLEQINWQVSEKRFLNTF